MRDGSDPARRLARVLGVDSARSHQERSRRCTIPTATEKLEQRLLLSSVLAPESFQPNAAAELKPQFNLHQVQPGATETTSPSVIFQVAAATSGPQLTVNVSTLYLNDMVGGSYGNAREVTLKNTGTSDLIIQPTQFVIAGSNADQFLVDKSSYPLLISAGSSATLRVRMQATAAGIATATLTIASNDPTGRIATINLRGLGTSGNTTGPTPQQVLDLYRIPMPITRPNASLGGTSGDEQSLQVFTKAGPGPVTIETLGVTATGNVGGDVLKLYWYDPTVSPATTTSLLTTSGVDAASVAPKYGTAQFDPGGTPFGLVGDWPGLGDHSSWSEDKLNAWETNANQRRKVRFFALRDANGAIVENAFVVTIESGSGSSSRVATLLARNIRHASLPTGLLSRDVGSVAVAGRTSDASGIYNLTGGGAGIGGAADSFHYAYRTVTGDGEIVARVTSVSNGSGKAGVMFRQSLEPGSIAATMTLSAGGESSFQYRASTNGGTTASKSSAGAPRWVRLVRSGNTVTGYRSADGVSWTLQGSVTLALGSTYDVGLAATAGTSSALTTASIAKVAIKVAAGTTQARPTIITRDTVGGVTPVRVHAGDNAVSARLRVNGALVGGTRVGGGPYDFSWDSRKIADGVYPVTAEITYADGTVATKTASIRVSNPQNPPSVRLTGIAEGATIRWSVPLSAEATDERGVAGVQFYIDNSAVGGEVAAAPYTQTLDTTILGDGWHTITAVARDISGLPATSLPLRVYVQTRSQVRPFNPFKRRSPLGGAKRRPGVRTAAPCCRRAFARRLPHAAATAAIRAIASPPPAISARRRSTANGGSSIRTAISTSTMPSSASRPRSTRTTPPTSPRSSAQVPPATPTGPIGCAVGCRTSASIQLRHSAIRPPFSRAARR